jgi:hypothetical protein
LAIQYPLAWPTHRGLRDIVIRRRKIVGGARSPFSILSEQFYEWPGNERWEADINLPPMGRNDASPWIAWLLSMDGPIGTFLMGDPDGATPRGLGTGVPQVDGGGQLGKELAIKTGLGTTANWLRAATVDNEIVTVVGAKGLWRLDGATVEEAIDAARHHRAMMITAIEASAG